MALLPSRFAPLLGFPGRGGTRSRRRGRAEPPTRKQTWKAETVRHAAKCLAGVKTGCGETNETMRGRLTDDILFFFFDLTPRRMTLMIFLTFFPYNKSVSFRA